MAVSSRRPRDIAVLDNVDALSRHTFVGSVWRITREGRDPLQGGSSNSRWCNGDFDVLYTCLERDGAIAEIYSLLAAQPVFPSKLQSYVHRLEIAAEQALILADNQALERLGVEVARYREREYGQTQALADAAHFLGFDGLIVPSARWPCQNAVLFTDRIAPSAITLVESETEPVDWAAWRKGRLRASRE